MSSMVLDIREVVRSFSQGEGQLVVLNGVHLTIRPGEIVALVGPSGSGKSTLLQIAGLLDTPTSGSVLLEGEEMNTANDGARTRARLGRIGFVYQFHHLLPEFSALENVMMPQLIAGVETTQASAKAKSLLTELGLEARLAHRPAKLSGGEQQRVAIARALANDPVLLLADEPTGNLDPHTAEQVFSLLLKLVRQKNLSALVATHNLDLARRMDKTVTMQDGTLQGA